jgi:hypothetical protein
MQEKIGLNWSIQSHSAAREFCAGVLAGGRRLGDEPCEWHLTQNDDYLRMWIDRLSKSPLRWVSQFVELIDAYAAEHGLDRVRLNDIGCCVGGFIVGSRQQARVAIDYHGYDLSDIYLREARKHFPEQEFRRLDISRDEPEPADVTVMSATLEHIVEWRDALENVMASTRHYAMIRTFLAPNHEWAYYYKDGAAAPYPVFQFTFQEIDEAARAGGFDLTVIRDHATDSIPKYLGCGMTRTMYVCCLRKA